jgi:cytoskeletal protein RodZ
MILQGVANVQNESGQYEIPAHRLLVTFDGKRVGEGKNLGEARVVSTLFGKARVRIIHEQDKSWGWFLPLAVAAIGGILAAVWLWQDIFRQEPLHNAATPDVSAVTVQAVIPVPQSAPAMNGQAAPQPMQNQAQIPVESHSPMLATEKAVTTEPDMRQTATASAKKVRAKKMAATSKPGAIPAEADNDQPQRQAGTQQSATPPAAIQPKPIVKVERPVAPSVAEPVHESGAAAVVPQANDTQAGQANAQQP